VVSRFAEQRDQRCAAQFSEIDADEPMSLAMIWDLENRQRRGAFAAFTMERYFAALRAPFLDRPVVDLLTSVPPRWRFQQRLYKRMIVRSFPQARHVPWAYHRGRITDRPGYEFAREVVGFVKARALQRLKPGAAKTRWALRDNDALFRQERWIHDELLAWTRSGAFPGHTFDAPGVRAVAGRFFDRTGPQDGLGTLLGHLTAMMRWHRWALEGSPVRIPPEADPANFGVAI
jgi:hypothetical protein